MKSKGKDRGKKDMPLLVERRTSSSVLFDEREKLRLDYRWISARRATLAKQYPNKYVAVKDSTVILAEESPYTLLAKLKALGYKPNNVAVEFVTEQPICFV